MQGAITSTAAYATLGPMGQVVRRSGNVLTAITGPILFGILPQLPYIVAGSITLFWTAVVTLVMVKGMIVMVEVIVIVICDMLDGGRRLVGFVDINRTVHVLLGTLPTQVGGRHLAPSGTVSR